MAIQQKLYTADELWEISHQETDYRYELIDGELIEMAPAGGLHGIIAAKVGRIIGNYAEENNLGGLVTAAETGFLVEEHPRTVLAPDVGYIKAGRLQEIPEKYIPLSPDLAIEVISPNDKAAKIQEKTSRYLAFGTAQVWNIYPRSKQVVIHTSDGSKTLEKNDIIDGGEILPDFKLVVQDIFEL